MLKFQNATKIKTWLVAKKSNSLYDTMISNALIKLGWDQMKTVGGGVV